MRVHNKPILCLRNLVQQASDGGRAEYLDQERRSIGPEPELPTGDCAVVAVVHATFQPLTGRSYREAKWHLSTSPRHRMYRRPMKGEGRIDYWVRRIKQRFRPPIPNPIHGTPSDATGNWLAILGYEHIYPNAVNLWHCICDMDCTYVLDVLMPIGHTMAVHQRVAYTTASFNPDETEVVNVLRLGPERTRNLKAHAEYKKAEERWFQRWMEGGGRQLPDWKTRPKLEDYL